MLVNPIIDCFFNTQQSSQDQSQVVVVGLFLVSRAHEIQNDRD